MGESPRSGPAHPEHWFAFWKTIRVEAHPLSLPSVTTWLHSDICVASVSMAQQAESA